MLKVYFENAGGQYAELVAVFEREEDYAAVSTVLELKAKEAGFDYVTESEVEGSLADVVKDE